MWIRQALLFMIVLAVAGLPARAADLPEGFVYLRDVVPDIHQAMRYAGRKNFMRRRLPGYGAAECVLSRDAAKALGKVQNAAVQKGYTLVVFDCYRPQSAVEAMAAWVRQGGGTDPGYHPNVSRSRLVAEGYIGTKSSHARGSTVDVGFDVLDGTRADGEPPVCNRRDRETVDFGTPFDCFDPASNTDSGAVSGRALAYRKTLVGLMRQGGFRNYAGEWWHFTLNGEPFPDRSFDFEIGPR
ncbi:MAG: M15 family metallopeptidase [Roseibium sp.]